jgi:MobA/VirD2-like, nuclease domain/TraI-like middle domain/Large polyvalent protein-associated domain 7
MIAKRIEAKKNTTTIRRLANYIANPNKQADLRKSAGAEGGFAALAEYMDKKEAVVRISNCGFTTLSRAVKEIKAVQDKNTRSKIEKNYHLVLSFREGEQPDLETMAKIEDAMVEHIGYGEHQKISAVHTDTNNWHIHVAINKVHPESFRNVEPYYDKLRMNEKCRELEAEFGLLPDNGIHQVRRPAMNKAQEKEQHHGIESLASWVQENAAGNLRELLERQGATWADLHKELNKNGLTLRPRGAGFVFQDLSTGTTIKASTVGREFSKKNIENILGTYQEPKVLHTAERHYEAGPRQEQSNERDALWNRYREERQGQNKGRRELFAKLQEQRKESLQRTLGDIKRRKTEAFRSALMNKRQKKDVYASLQVQRLKALEKMRLLYRDHRNIIDESCPYLSWTAFLQKEVKAGNEVALKILRQKQSKGIHDQSSYIHKEDTESNRIYERLKYTVDKSGRIKYRLSEKREGWVLDAGRRIMPGSLDKDVLTMALQLAVSKYGRIVQVHGDEAFIQAATRAARSAKMDISINGSRVLPEKEVKSQERGTER